MNEKHQLFSVSICNKKSADELALSYFNSFKLPVRLFVHLILMDQDNHLEQ